jgi:RecG-like helicase
MSSLEALNNPRARAASRTEMFNHETHAENKANIHSRLNEQKHENSLRSFANQTLLSTLIEVGIFFGTRTWGGTELIAW